MPRDRASDLHPGASWFDGDESHDAGFWLRSAESPFGDGGDYPVLAAYLRHGASGRIASFSGWIGSAGE